MRLIDADALFINLDDMMAVSPTGYIHGDTVADMISDAPTVEAEPVGYGKWVDPEAFKRPWFRHHIFKCSVCGNTLDMDGVNAGRGDANYCPNCGAKMDG